MRVNTYLLFNGQCEEAFKFYESLLGGKIVAMMAHEGTPAAKNVPAEWRSKILHAFMTIGDQVLMGSDAPPAHQQKPQAAPFWSQATSAEQPRRMHVWASRFCSRLLLAS